MAMLLGTTAAYAEGNITPHALVRYEHDSNLLLVPSDTPRQDASGEYRLEDSFEDYAGGIDGEYRWRDNRFYLTTNYSHFVYQNFTQLNHDEFAGTTGLDWTATYKIKGNIGTQYNRHQLSLLDVNISDPNLSYIETTQITNASATYDMNSHWRVDGGISYLTAKLPDAGAQSYDANESQGNAGVKFIGSANLTTGVSVNRKSGHYKNSNQPGYTQTAYEYTIDYKLGARTLLSGVVGYNVRVQTGFDVSATTGSFSFSQQLTPKTSYYLKFLRALDTYNTTFGSQLTTGGTAGLSWQATEKIMLSANYTYNKANVKGEFTGTTATQRDDTVKSTEVSLKYAALRWLTITPYYRYENRNSQLAAFTFRNNTYGINFEARFQP